MTMLGTEVPIDSLIRQMKRGRSYMLGLGRATPLSPVTSRTWSSRVAYSLFSKTQRKTLLIETESQSELEGRRDFGSQVGAVDAALTDVNPAPLPDEPSVTKIAWTARCDGEPSPSRSVWDRQAMKALGSFPKWKEEYPLIILHLGTLDSMGFAMLGKLCDGIALAADMSHSQTASLRGLARTLRHHQSHGCRLLGMWSVEIG